MSKKAWMMHAKKNNKKKNLIELNQRPDFASQWQQPSANNLLNLTSIKKYWSQNNLGTL